MRTPSSPRHRRMALGAGVLCAVTLGVSGCAGVDTELATTSVISMQQAVHEMKHWAATRTDLPDTDVRQDSARDGRWSVYISPATSNGAILDLFGGDDLPANACVAITSARPHMFTYREAADKTSCDLSDPALTQPLSPQDARKYDVDRARDWEGLLAALRTHADAPVATVRSYHSAVSTYSVTDSSPASPTETSMTIFADGTVPYSLGDNPPQQRYALTVATNGTVVATPASG